MSNKNTLGSNATDAVKNNPFTTVWYFFNALVLNRHYVNGKWVKGADKN